MSQDYWYENRGKKAHEDERYVDVLLDDAEVQADESDDHRDLTPGCHAHADSKRRSMRQPSDAGAKVASDDLGEECDDGQRDEEPEDL